MPLSRAISVLEFGRFVILSGCSPRYPSNSGCGTQPDPHGALAVALTALGFTGRFWETFGRYGGAEEPGYLVSLPREGAAEVNALMRLAREFGQECILHVADHRASFWYVNGPLCHPSDNGPQYLGPEGDGFSYLPCTLPPLGNDNYTRVDLNGKPLYFAFDVPAGAEC